MEVTPQGATLTKNAPGISFGKPELNIAKPIINKIIGEITNFRIDIEIENLLTTFFVLKESIIPIANKPTGETQAASVDKVYSIGVLLMLKFDIKNNKPIIMDKIIGFVSKFLIKTIKFTFFFIDNSKKKEITDNNITPSINIILATCVIISCWKNISVIGNNKVTWFDNATVKAQIIDSGIDLLKYL